MCAVTDKTLWYDTAARTLGRAYCRALFIGCFFTTFYASKLSACANNKNAFCTCFWVLEAMDGQLKDRIGHLVRFFLPASVARLVARWPPELKI